MSMRSTFAGLNTMVSGINANRLSLDTVGHNITNADTTGYSRQSVNLAATKGQEIYSIYGSQIVGTGTDSLSITRARNVYADKQYWKENSDNSYFTSRQTNYSKLEAIFNDSSNTGISNAMSDFYKSWVEVSSSASTSTTRQTVIDGGQAFADRLATANKQVQQQITANYDDISANVSKVNNLTDQIVALNKNIASIEATGANANDLRDQRDNLADELSGYTQTSVYENANGMYTVVCNGTSLVSGVTKLNLEMSKPVANSAYGINDYEINIKETGTTFDAGSGTLQAEKDAIAEDKTYIDKLSNMAAFMLTTFNAQHKAGYGMSGSTVDTAKTDINFYGDNSTIYTWDAKTGAVKAQKDGETSSLKGAQIIEAMTVNTKLTGADGESYLAVTGGTVTSTKTETAATTDTYQVTTDLATGNKTTIVVKDGEQTTTVSAANNTADGSNAVLLSALFNSAKGNTVNTIDARAISDVSLNSYYNTAMTNMGSLSEAMNDKTSAQNKIMTQVSNWRSSTSGVNWNEELTNMIKFQQGFSACSRCLTTMDEMLDKLVNSTGTVGR